MSRITGAYFATVKDGELGIFALADGLLSGPRVLNPENPRTEFMMNERNVDLSTIAYLGINDGFGRTHGKWLVGGRRRREAKRLMKQRPAKRIG